MTVLNVHLEEESSSKDVHSTGNYQTISNPFSLLNTVITSPDANKFTRKEGIRNLTTLINNIIESIKIPNECKSRTVLLLVTVPGKFCARILW